MSKRKRNHTPSYETFSIKEITEERLLFSNGKYLEYDHAADWCEWNYADWDSLDSIGRKAKFVEPLEFEAVEGSGFRFGNKPYNMHFIPCYSEQDGYYSSDIDIYYDGKPVLHIDECDERYY